MEGESGRLRQKYVWWLLKLMEGMCGGCWDLWWVCVAVVQTYAGVCVAVVRTYGGVCVAGVECPGQSMSSGVHGPQQSTSEVFIVQSKVCHEDFRVHGNVPLRF